MRPALRGQSRKVLAPRGVKVVQRFATEVRVELPHPGRLAAQRADKVGVDRKDAPQAHILRPVLEEWDLEAVVWDRAPSHRAKGLGELRTAGGFLPSYGPLSSTRPRGSSRRGAAGWRG